MQRLDLYSAAFTQKLFQGGFSRNLVQKFIRQNGVVVSGKRVWKPHYEVRPEDAVQLEVHEWRAFFEKMRHAPAKSEQTRTFSSDEILFENQHFLVLNKPAFVTTEEYVRGFFPVHRLDKDTSGVLVAAKDLPTQAQLQDQWQKRAVKKTYVALLKGNLTPATGAIDAAIGRSMKDRKKMAVSARKTSRKSFTEYQVVRQVRSGNLDESFTWARLFPATGRTHQIRVHCSSIGYPVVGDKVYGDKKLNKKVEQNYGLSRQFLHAEKLEIVNPTTKKRKTFIAPLSQDLKIVYAAIFTTSTSLKV